MIGIFGDILLQSWLVLGQMAPYLLFGFLVAGLLSVCVSPQWVERHLGGSGLGPVVKASLFGVPLPLCSCGVIPVSASIRRHGASRAATTSFLLSTPQTGVDSIAVSYALLGPVFAVFRPVAALLTGLLGGTVVQIFDRRARGNSADDSTAPVCTEPCCQDSTSHNAVVRGLRYGLVSLPRDIGVPLLVGVLIAGAMAVLVPKGRLEPLIGGGLLSILLMMAAAVPVYVCATASVPIAAGSMHMGASAGAALAFLIAGPATNAAAFTALWKLMGRRTALLYLGIVSLSAVICGLLIDAMFPNLSASMPQVGAHLHEPAAAGWLTHAGAVVLLGVIGFSCRGKFLPKTRRQRKEVEQTRTSPPGDRQRLELRVRGMTCSHCAQSVQRALAACSEVESAEVDLQGGRAVVVGQHLDHRQLLTAVAQLGYTAEIPAEQ